LTRERVRQIRDRALLAVAQLAETSVLQEYSAN
jgi:DNA-directed RNA polymerase sigma subunit (sigma70/sigma32)